MIAITNLSKSHGNQALFVDASFQLNPGEKVGLVGPNGSGKSTLFRLIVGEEPADDGEVSVPKRVTIGYFRQEQYDLRDRSVLDEAIHGSGRLGDLHHELFDLEHAMADPERAFDLERILARFGEVQGEYQQLGGYELEARAKEVLHGLGFSDEQFQSDVGALSGIGHPRKAARLGQRAAHILNAIDAVNDEGIAVTATINPLRTRYRLMVRTSPVHRFGVYTKEPIPAGHRVIEYTGEKIARAEAKRRWDPVRSYLFELDSYWRLDGAVGGSGAEYINHSCVPNLVTRQRGHRIFYFSKRRIATGEELTVDYKYAADLPPMACRCLAPDCRGTMNRLNLPRPKSLAATGRVSDTG
jgi:energy-coupling factor transporter ATP-binding protein EcfA2